MLTTSTSKYVLAFSAFGATLATAEVASAQITGAHLDQQPVAYVDRPLVLPKLHMYAGLETTFTHAETGGIIDASTNSGFIDLDAGLGILDDLDVDATFISLATKEGNIWPLGVDLIDGADWGMFRLAATLRFFSSDAADIGARFRFLIDNDATIGLNGGLPIRVRAGHVFRLDTGFSFIGILPTREGASPTFSLSDVGPFMSASDPAIPLRFAFQPTETFWLGFHTGFGALDVSEDNSIFLPLGANLGGTIEIDRDMLLDLIGSFAFPFFILPAGFDTDGIIGSELWQVGLTGKFYFKIPT